MNDDLIFFLNDDSAWFQSVMTAHDFLNDAPKLKRSLTLIERLKHMSFSIYSYDVTKVMQFWNECVTMLDECVL